VKFAKDNHNFFARRVPDELISAWQNFEVLARARVSGDIRATTGDDVDQEGTKNRPSREPQRTLRFARSPYAF